MEMKLIESALALVLVYLVLALLASHFQELLTGGFGGRRKGMREMVQQVFGGDRASSDAFFAYAPIRALSHDGKQLPTGIPPDLFAQAYLAVVNGGTPPRGKFATPADFVHQAGARTSTQAVLDLHAADAGTDWDTFEANVARWISDIGDRSTGAFKRRKAGWILFTALGLAVVLDVDTFYMTSVFMNDEETRVAFANLAELTNAQNKGTKPDDATAAKLTPAASSFERASRAAVQFSTASAEIGAALKDPKVLAFGSDRDDVRAYCGGDLEPVPLKHPLYASNSDAWIALLPEIVRRLGEAQLGVVFAPAADKEPSDKMRTHDGGGADRKKGRTKAAEEKPGTPVPVPAGAVSATPSASPAPAVATSMPEGDRAQSLTSRQTAFGIWVKGSPDRAAAVQVAPATAGGTASRPRSHRLNDSERADVLGEVQVCANVVHSWVAGAQGQAGTDAANQHLGNAEKALRAGIQMVHAEGLADASRALLPTLLLADEESFDNCAAQSGNSRAQFDQCLSNASRARLPFGWQNARAQFCVARIIAPDAADESTATASFGCPDYPGAPALDLPRIKSAFSGMKGLYGLAGLLITTLMVSLGAPFWWGVLGKVADLRLAGRVRGLDDKADAPPSPSPVPAPAQASLPASTADTATIDGASNAFERGLRVQDVTRVQKALGIEANGRLDGPTRDAIEKFLATQGRPSERELSATNFPLITSRQAAVAATVVTATGEWRRLQAVQLAARTQLALALNGLFATADGWRALNLTTDKYDDTLRARVVQYRALTDPAASTSKFQDTAVAKLSTQPDSPLCRIDDVLRQSIGADKRAPLKRQSPAYWFDIALGELGITEDGSPKQSNPRVIEYLASLGEPPIEGDETPWCGAFAGWVMAQAQLLQLPDLTGPKGSLLRAIDWQTYGASVQAGSQQMGDICVVEVSPGQHHVGFWVDGDATRFWLLGGNQGNSGSGGVTIVAWRRSVTPIAALRRPSGLVAPIPAA